MLVASIGLASSAWQPSGVTAFRPPTDVRCRRHAEVIARELTFAADLTVTTDPFTVSSSKGLGEFFSQPEALQILMSQAESSKRLDAGDATASAQTWEVNTPIEFPGMVARSQTPMDITIDPSTPTLSVTSGQSKTVCEGGPTWAQSLLARIGDIADTSSSNVIQVREAAGSSGQVCVSSTVNLTVRLSIPTLLLPPFVPAGPFEKAGSESIQQLLDKDMAPVLAKFRAAYLEWAK